MFMSRSNANSLSLRGYGPDILKNLQSHATFTFLDDNITAIANDNSDISVRGELIKDDKYDWVIKLRNESVATLKMKTNISGTHTWNVSFEGIHKDMDLMFHPCSIYEFPCSNGHQCVPLEDRCNLVAECQDASDEKTCFSFITKDGYNSLVPNVDTKNEPINITINIIIVDLFVENLKDNVFKVVYEMEIFWSDPGLTLMNLLKEDFDNKIRDTELKTIWVPEISYENDDKSKSSVIENYQNVEMQRMSDALTDDPRELIRNRKYSGRVNRLKQSSLYSVDLHCQFSTHGFPYLPQTCQMNLLIGGMKPDLINISENSKVDFWDNFTEFGQYELAGGIKKTVTTEKGRKLFSIEISFQIATKYPMLNWYLPLFVLVMVSQLTAYMDLERFYETALSVNATIFVALSSFFTSITGSVPPSAKMTIFELWVTITFIYPFSMILIQVLK